MQKPISINNLTVTSLFRHIKDKDYIAAVITSKPNIHTYNKIKDKCTNNKIKKKKLYSTEELVKHGKLFVSEAYNKVHPCICENKVCVRV